ncbi:MAG: hypothetical protein AB7O96_12085 [Pseudobdellovibrionaceae bacterium]
MTFSIKTLSSMVLALGVMSFSANAELEKVNLDSTTEKIQWVFNQLPDLTSDQFVAPKIEQYKMQGSVEETLRVLNEDHGFALNEETGEDGGRTLYSHLGVQADQALETSPDLDQNIVKTTLHAAMKRTFAFLKNENVEIYADYDTYWAPSVNAMALVIIDDESGIVTVILHGDIDG